MTQQRRGSLPHVGFRGQKSHGSGMPTWQARWRQPPHWAAQAADGGLGQQGEVLLLSTEQGRADGREGVAAPARGTVEASPTVHPTVFLARYHAAYFSRPPVT